MDIPLARGRFDVVAGVLIVVYAAVMTAVVAGVSAWLDGVALLVVLGILVFAWLFHASTFVYAWRKLRQVPFPLGVHGDGLHDRSPLREQVVPWDAVRTATLENRLLRSPLLKVDQVDPAAHGIRWSLRLLDISPEELRQAFTVQSGGRVVLG